MIIALTRDHPAYQQLTDLSCQVRNIRHGAGEPECRALAEAINITETVFAHGVVSFEISPGQASEHEAIRSYQHLRRYYPAVLDILCVMAAQKKDLVTVEIGSLSPEHKLDYSSHDLLKIMPRILGMFRGSRI